MAVRIPIITDLQDKGIRDAKKAFGDFKTAIGNAEGGLGKFQAGSKVVFDTVKANAGNLAIAGGAAFVAFAGQGIKAFQDLALQAGKFADATGLAVQDASRYIEFAGDIAVPIDAIEGAIGRLNKTIGTDPDMVRNLGVDLVYLKDGSLDVNETFLNTIQRIKDIKDPAEKARVAAKLLGKGWQATAELIEMGATDVRKALKNVSDEQVIDPAELERAKKFRDTMDDLADKTKKIALALGEFLVPIITDIVEIIDRTVTGLGDMYGWLQKQWKKTYFATAWDEINITAGMMVDDIKEGLGDIFGMFSDQKEVIPVFAEDMRNARQDAKDFKEAIKEARNPLDELTTSVDKAAIAIGTAEAAWKNLIGQFERKVSFDKLDTDLATLRETAIAAFSGGKEEMDAFNAAALVVAEDFAKFAENFPPELSTQLSIEVNSMDLERLERAASLVKFLDSPIGSGGNDASIYRRVSTPLVAGARANGGPVGRGSTYLVGEQGPELFTPGTSGNITPNNALSGGGNITVNVMSADPNEVVRALQAYNRNVGKLPVSVQ
jgi:hypothetical protein